MVNLHLLIAITKLQNGEFILYCVTGLQRNGGMRSIRMSCIKLSNIPNKTATIMLLSKIPYVVSLCIQYFC